MESRRNPPKVPSERRSKSENSLEKKKEKMEFEPDYWPESLDPQKKFPKFEDVTGLKNGEVDIEQHKQLIVLALRKEGIDPNDWVEDDYDEQATNRRQRYRPRDLPDVAHLLSAEDPHDAAGIPAENRQDDEEEDLLDDVEEDVDRRDHAEVSDVQDNSIDSSWEIDNYLEIELNEGLEGPAQSPAGSGTSQQNVSAVETELCSPVPSTSSSNASLPKPVFAGSGMSDQDEDLIPDNSSRTLAEPSTPTSSRPALTDSDSDSGHNSSRRSHQQVRDREPYRPSGEKPKPKQKQKPQLKRASQLTFSDKIQQGRDRENQAQIRDNAKGSKRGGL